MRRRAGSMSGGGRSTEVAIGLDRRTSGYDSNRGEVSEPLRAGALAAKLDHGTGPARGGRCARDLQPPRQGPPDPDRRVRDRRPARARFLRAFPPYELRAPRRGRVTFQLELSAEEHHDPLRTDPGRPGGALEERFSARAQELREQHHQAAAGQAGGFSEARRRRGQRGPYQQASRQTLRIRQHHRRPGRRSRVPCPGGIPTAAQPAATAEPRRSPASEAAPLAPQPGPVARALAYLQLQRADLVALAALTVVAFVLRFFSPIFPDLYAHPQDHFALDNCVVNTPVNSKASLGALCGLGYPYQRGYPSNGSLAPAHGEIFDEVYFGDFAHQDLIGQYYFDPEPPLGKLIIASGEWLYGWWRATFEQASGSYADLGFTPFGFRIMGVLFGSLVIPLLYLLALRLWPNRLFAAAAALLACFDGMFFVQSRIGMIDIFPIFFILLAYWVFHLHLDSPTRRSSIASLLATGVVLGLAVAAKWIALAALATMVVILAVRAARRVVDVRLTTAGGLWAWGRSEAVGPALPGGVRAATYLPVAVLAFVVIPFFIYYASWWPNFFQHGYFKGFSDFWSYQVSSYVYHATLTASHPYGSPWYSWPFLYRPVAYYWEAQGLGVDANTGQPLVAGLINLGNPWIWWSAIPCLLAMPYFAIRHRSYAAAFILLAFLTQY
ncbi:MAG: phospholipid carrier-dependent glycosyltransferase, partial [Chloroflexi bacterium]